MKNYKLKIICLLCVTAALSSCKKNELTEEKGLTGNHKNLAIAGDGKWDLLGHGYDITGELFERKNSSKVSIIDIEKFYKAYPTRIPTPTDTKGGYNVYYGANAYDYVKDVNSKQKFGATSTAGDKDKGYYGTSNFSLTNDNQNTFTYNGKYSYATYESWYRIKSIDFTDDVTTDLLKNYLTPEFLAYLSNYSAEQIVKTYGTHILLGIDIGGRLKYDYRGSIVKETTFEQKLRAVKAGFSIGIAKIFSIDLSADVSKEEKTTISNETTDKLFTGTFYGGSTSGTSFSGDALGNTSQSINLSTWQQSIDAKNASLIGINRSAPIYDFITDPVKKQQVKVAVEKYINDRQIALSPQEVYEFSTSILNKHANSLNPNMHLNYLSGGWHPNGQPFKAYSLEYNGTVPVYQFVSPTNGDRILWTDKNFTYSNYVYGGIVFYAYKYQKEGTVPVYQFASMNGNPDHLYNPNPDFVAPYYPNWQRDGVAFYAFPN
jgi:hypothetical protein